MKRNIRSGRKPHEITVTWTNGRKPVVYTTDSLELLMTDQEVKEIMDNVTGEILYSKSAMASRRIRKTPIKSAYVADPNLDPRFDFEIDDNFEIYDRIGASYCQVLDYVADGRNAAIATIAIASEDDYFGADKYVESGIEEYMASMTNGTDYGYSVISVKRVLSEPSYFSAYDMQNYDDTFNPDYNYNWFVVTVEIFVVSDSDDFWEADL